MMKNRSLISTAKPGSRNVQDMDAFIHEGGSSKTPGANVPSAKVPTPSPAPAKISTAVTSVQSTAEKMVSTEPMTKFPLSMPEWMHNKIRHLTVDLKISMSDYIVEKLLLNPELQKPKEEAMAIRKQKSAGSRSV